MSCTTTASFSANLFKVQALMLSVPVAFFELSFFNNFFTCSILGTRGELSGKPSGLINDNAGTWSFHGLVKISWSLSTTVYRSSGVGVVDFDVSLLAPLMLKSRGEIFFQRVKQHSYFGATHCENSEDSSNCCNFEWNILREWKLLQRFTFCLSSSINKNS